MFKKSSWGRIWPLAASYSKNVPLWFLNMKIPRKCGWLAKEWGWYLFTSSMEEPCSFKFASSLLLKCPVWGRNSSSGREYAGDAGSWLASWILEVTGGQPTPCPLACGTAWDDLLWPGPQKSSLLQEFRNLFPAIWSGMDPYRPLKDGFCVCLGKPEHTEV